MRLVQLYLAAVASKTISLERNSALYCLAINQISKFIFNLEIEEKLRIQILRLVLSAEEKIRTEILMLGKIDMNEPHIRLKESLEEGKERWIKCVKSQIN